MGSIRSSEHCSNYLQSSLMDSDTNAEPTPLGQKSTIGASDADDTDSLSSFDVAESPLPKPAPKRKNISDLHRTSKLPRFKTAPSVAPTSSSTKACASPLKTTQSLNVPPKPTKN